MGHFMSLTEPSHEDEAFTAFSSLRRSAHAPRSQREWQPRMARITPIELLLPHSRPFAPFAASSVFPLRLGVTQSVRSPRPLRLCGEPPLPLQHGFFLVVSQARCGSLPALAPFDLATAARERMIVRSSRSGYAEHHGSLEPNTWHRVSSHERGRQRL